jgi:NADH-quinone oxidoreductase subunit H
VSAAIDWVFWILLVARIVVVFFALLISVMLAIWLERKIVADLQTRIGPNRAGPGGILITLADGIKLFFKEGVTPVTASRRVFVLAPILSLIPAFLAFAVIPFGAGVTLFDHEVPFQIADLDIGILWILAMGSLAVYGVVLAGWSSGSNYPLLGAIRSSAQMISYEVGMSLGLVAVLLYSGTIVMSEIVAVQARHFEVTGLGWLPKWNIFFQLPAFLIYFTAAIAETQRPPFDLAEAETELVAGYHTEYSGIKFAMFFLAEYTHMITVSAVGVTIFFGGWHGPMFGVVPWLWPILWFLLKLVIVIFVLVWVRATIPRFRYDRLMNFGWKVLIPLGLLWILVTAAYLTLPSVYGDGRAAVIIVSSTLAIVLLLWPLFAARPRGHEDGPSGSARRRPAGARVP